MTHIQNIPHILEFGITHQNSAKSNKNYVSIGYLNLISQRDNFILPNGNRLGDYIPFYFGFRMPMLYVIMLGANSIKYEMKSISSEDIIYCVTSVEKMSSLNLNFIFSNGHALSALTEFYNKADVNNINNLIDRTAINALYWNDENDLDLKRRKEAEFLIENDLPADAILGFVVFNDNARDTLLQYGISENKIAVRPSYYF